MIESHIPESDSLRHRLKTMTQQLHDRIEATSLAGSLASGHISAKQYLAYLQMLLVVHETIEEKAGQFDHWKTYGVDLDEHKRAHLLHRDIKLLDTSPQHTSQTPIPDIQWDFPEIVGALYVLEGSTMGGQILSQNIAHLALSQKVPNHYFRAYGSKTMQRWQSYVSLIDAYGRDEPSMQSRVCDGAIKTFEWILGGIHALEQ
jgi:heme oxygenase (biliverdin-IX-beta and delta-forming)